MDDNQQLGLAKMKEVFGERITEDRIEKLSHFSPAFSEYLLNFVAQQWGRPAFDNKLREALLVSCLIGQGNSSEPLQLHLQGMLNAGWTKDEIIELMILLVGYAGLPAVSDAMDLLVELCVKQA